MHPYRAVTGERGAAELRVAKGSYKLFVSQTSYLTFGLPVDVTANMTVYCDVTSGTATRSSWPTDIVLCDGPYVTNVQVSSWGAGCKSMTVSVWNPYSIENYLWYQGARGDTSHPLTSYNGNNGYSVCAPTAPAQYWCRVVAEDLNQGVTCYTDTQAVTMP